MSQANGWTGADSTRARAYWAPQVATGTMLCSHCHRTINPEDLWDVDHLEPLALGGSRRDLSNTAPAHRHCNRKAGQALAQHRRRKRATQARRIRPW